MYPKYPELTAALDAGHGGSDSGAINKDTGLKESDMALDVVLRTKQLLTPYVNVVLTRSDDTFLPLNERPRIANHAGANAFLSYHFNSSSSPKTKSSSEIFTTRGQNNSDRLATCVMKRHDAQFSNVQTVRAGWSDGDVDKEANFAVLRGTNHPAALMEGEFIHTTHGSALIADPNNRQKMAVANAQGILDFFGVTHTIS